MLGVFEEVFSLILFCALSLTKVKVNENVKLKSKTIGSWWICPFVYIFLLNKQHAVWFFIFEKYKQRKNLSNQEPVVFDVNFTFNFIFTLVRDRALKCIRIPYIPYICLFSTKKKNICETDRRDIRHIFTAVDRKNVPPQSE